MPPQPAPPAVLPADFIKNYNWYCSPHLASWLTSLDKRTRQKLLEDMDQNFSEAQNEARSIASDFLDNLQWVLDICFGLTCSTQDLVLYINHNKHFYWPLALRVRIPTSIRSGLDHLDQLMKQSSWSLLLSKLSPRRPDSIDAGVLIDNVKRVIEDVEHGVAPPLSTAELQAFRAETYMQIESDPEDEARKHDDAAPSETSEDAEYLPHLSGNLPHLFNNLSPLIRGWLQTKSEQGQRDLLRLVERYVDEATTQLLANPKSTKTIADRALALVYGTEAPSSDELAYSSLRDHLKVAGQALLPVVSKRGKSANEPSSVIEPRAYFVLFLPVITFSS